jgi:hypothetical protein
MSALPPKQTFAHAIRMSVPIADIAPSQRIECNSHSVGRSNDDEGLRQLRDMHPYGPDTDADRLHNLPEFVEQKFSDRGATKKKASTFGESRPKFASLAVWGTMIHRPCHVRRKRI